MDDQHYVSRFHGWPIYPPYHGTAGDYLFFPMQAVDVAEHLENLTQDQINILNKFPGFQDIQNIQEDDEVVLVLLTAKNF